MIAIQCQSCTKVYSVPADQIGKSGRMVKCTSCNFTWYEYPHVKKGWYLVLTVIVCIAMTGFCFVTTNPSKIKKSYEHLVHKLVGYKKEQNIDTSEFYRDYLLLSHLEPYNFKLVKGHRSN